MKFLIIGKFYTEGFAQHISETLQDMGHEVCKFEPGHKYKTYNSKFMHYGYKLYSTINNIYEKTPEYEKKLNKQLQGYLEKEEKIDITIVCYDFLTPKHIKTLKTFCNFVTMWFPDAISNLSKAMCIVSDYDIIFFKDPYIVDILSKEYGLKNIKYLAECANVKYLRPMSGTNGDILKYGCDISFIGNSHAYRISLVKQLLEYDIKIWGNLPPYWLDTKSFSKVFANEFLANEEKAKAFIYSKINLNSLHPAEIYGVNVRTFEIAACGAFQICNFRRELSNLFEEDKEIVTFKSINELRSKIDYYLNEPELRKEIGKNAHQRVINNHTYQHRIETILQAYKS